MNNDLLFENGHTPVKESHIPIPASSNLKYSFPATGTKLNSSYLPSALNSIGGNSLVPNMDLIQAKIEHLEKERVDLTLQLHRRSEKDRERKMKMDQAESKIKDLEYDNSKLSNALQAAQYDCVTLKLDKEELELELARRKKEADSGAHFEALDVWNKLSAATMELKRAEAELTQLRMEKSTLQKEKADAIEHMENISKRIQILENERRDMLAYKSELEESNLRIGFLQKIESTLEDEVRELKEKLKHSTESLMNEVERLETENKSFKSEIESLTTTIRMLTIEKEDNILISKNDFSYYQSQVTEAKSTQEALFESERRRRELHNKLQEVRGNIRVFVRCRPFLEGDATDEINSCRKPPMLDNLQPCLTFFKDESSLCLSTAAFNAIGSSLRNTRSMLGSPSQPFTFDKIFSMEATQRDVYKEVSELVQSALDGYRVCILSYGQSGSGKVRSNVPLNKFITLICFTRPIR